jgi:hypothetical protein
MAQSDGRDKGFLNVLTSGWTLVPAVLALSVLEVAWILELEDFEQTACYWIAGLLGGLAGLTFLIRYLAGGGAKVPADVAQAREELLANLDTLGRSLQRRLANESTPAGSMASVES